MWINCPFWCRRSVECNRLGGASKKVNFKVHLFFHSGCICAVLRKGGLTEGWPIEDIIIDCPQFDVYWPRLLFWVFTVGDDDFVVAESGCWESPGCFSMGLPLRLDIFGEDQDSIFLLLEQKDPAFGGKYLDLAWTTSVTLRSVRRMGCDLGSGTCSLSCSGTKKLNFLSCYWPLIYSIDMIKTILILWYSGRERSYTPYRAITHLSANLIN